MTHHNPPNEIRLLLIVNIRLLREGLVARFRQSGLSVVAAFENRENVHKRVSELKPHLVLLDVGFNSKEGLSVLQQIGKECAGVKSIVMNILPEQADVVGFIQAGVSGFVSEEATFEDILKTTQLVAAGGKVLPQSLMAQLFTQIADSPVRGVRSPLATFERLTVREREIMALIANGESNKEIARQLNVATFTVKSHVHNILEKLALRSRAQVASCYALSGARPGNGVAHTEQP